MTNGSYYITLTLALLAFPATNKFTAFDATGRPNWYITDSNTLKSTRLTVTTTNEGVFRVEVTNNLGNSNSWVGTEFQFTGPTTNEFKDLALPEKDVSWFLKVTKR